MTALLVSSGAVLGFQGQCDPISDKPRAPEFDRIALLIDIHPGRAQQWVTLIDL